MTELSNVMPESRSDTVLATPDKMARIRDLFGIDSDMEVPAFSEADERVPDLDPAYVFAAAALSGLIRPSDQGMRNAWSSPCSSMSRKAAGCGGMRSFDTRDRPEITL